VIEVLGWALLITTSWVVAGHDRDRPVHPARRRDRAGRRRPRDRAGVAAVGLVHTWAQTWGKPLTGTLIWLAVDLAGLAGICWLLLEYGMHLRIRYGLALGLAGTPMVLALVLLLSFLR
jgi:hypothetical protein